ncbi:MAG TPA: hypothetical protein VJQ57_09450 [Acidimicrobiia bacterium]|nr:hypothetical protein [Acidimicrobiia bacterium]
MVDVKDVHAASPLSESGEEFSECSRCHTWNESVATEVQGFSQSHG